MKYHPEASNQSHGVVGVVKLMVCVNLPYKTALNWVGKCTLKVVNPNNQRSYAMCFIEENRKYVTLILTCITAWQTGLVKMHHRTYSEVDLQS